MDEKKKEGMSVRELEGYAKKHRFEIFFCLLFVFASLFTLVFWGSVISIFLAGLGAIIGSLFPAKTEMMSHKVLQFFVNEKGTTQYIIMGAALLIAIFLAPIVFLLLGLHGGKDLATHLEKHQR